MQLNRTLTIIALAGLAGAATAQDSVSLNTDGGNGLPGDGLSPFDLDSQVVRFVLDLAELTTSKGNRFGVGPIIKTNKVANDFFGSLTSGMGMSDDALTGVDGGGDFGLWENAAGFGVNPDAMINTAPSTISLSGTVSQFAVGVSEFATNQGGSNHGAVNGAIVNYDPANPSRLYVTRVVAANGNGDSLTGDTATFGYGSVDANGNLYFRADENNVTGSPFGPTLGGNNVYRVNLDLRSDSDVNFISDDPADYDATDRLVTNDGGVFAAPNNIPQSVFGGNGAVSGVTFGTTFYRGDAAIVDNADHLTAGVTATRGNIGSTTKTILDSGIITQAIYFRTGGEGINRSIGVWSTDAALNVVENHIFTLPPLLTDNLDGFNLPAANGQLYGAESQTPFRGSCGPVALGQDRNDKALAAAMFSFNTAAGDQDPFTSIVSLRFDDDGSNPEWALVGYILGGDGKAVCDENGDPIGELTAIFNVSPSLTGPSMSSPTIDGAGNVWFISAVELFNRIDTDDDGVPDASDSDTCLLRAVYNEADHSYELELVLELGSVFQGENSGLEYQIQFLDLLDSNSIGSGAPFSNAGRSHAWDNMSVDMLDNADPLTNGGMVLNANIVYDVDGDGSFDDPSGNSQNPASVDESYNALLFIGQAPSDGPEPCLADFDPNPAGVLDFNDVIAYLQAFASGDPSANLDAVPELNFNDVIIFLQAFAAGCP